LTFQPFDFLTFPIVTRLSRLSSSSLPAVTFPTTVQPRWPNPAFSAHYRGTLDPSNTPNLIVEDRIHQSGLGDKTTVETYPSVKACSKPTQ